MRFFTLGLFFFVSFFVFLLPSFFSGLCGRAIGVRISLVNVGFLSILSRPYYSAFVLYFVVLFGNVFFPQACSSLYTFALSSSASS